MKKATFEEIKNFWLDHVKEYADKDILIGIIGNKKDLFYDEQVSDSEAKSFADSIGAFLLFVSAKTVVGIKEIFKQAAERVIATCPEKPEKPDEVKCSIILGTDNLTQINTKTKKKKKFCS